MARTIDNLGLDSSTRWAQDREIYDDSFFKEAVSIPSQTKVATTTPHYASEFDALFDLDEQHISWAAFQAPAGYLSIRRRLFAEQLIPILGTPAKQEAQLERLQALGEKEAQEHPQEESEISRERKILIKLFENLGKYDLLLVDINSRRTQYQKG